MRLALGLAVLFGLSAGGCIIGVRTPGLVVLHADDDAHGAPIGRTVVIEKTHVHGDGCGHYWYNGQWYFAAGHVHRAGCGHVLHNGLWVLAGAVAIASGHTHNDHCGHYFHDGQWFFMRGHRHGPGCGHRWDGRVWISVKF